MTPRHLKALPFVFATVVALGEASYAAASTGETGETGEVADEEVADTGAPLDYETVVIGSRPPTPSLPGHRAGSEVDREELEQRLPRSAPDALRYEPGVFVQQTAHGQGSAFVRGLTGQQTLMVFDGVRLNNSTYRQGPNQYFFTLDAQTIDSFQITRGGGSTRYGSDALGGVILALPVEPRLRDAERDDLFTASPHLRFRGASADHDLGGRAQVLVTAGESLAFIGGAGGRRVGQLEGGGVLTNPEDGEPVLVPRLEDDGRTQLGTGFDELSADGRLVYRLRRGHTLKVASYLYRQYDAPRTDKCPKPGAPVGECRTYDEQFRTLVYAVWEGETAQPLLATGRLTLSWQRQHERRTDRRPTAVAIDRDSVDTFGVSFVGRTAIADVAPRLRLSGRWGADTYSDQVASAAWSLSSETGDLERQSRGQYLDGSSYLTGGAFVEATAFMDDVRLRAGGRVSWTVAEAPSDASSGTFAVDRAWFPLVGSAGLEWQLSPGLSLLANIDRSFRAPNLDDLTSRQSTGPGFQVENPDLAAEKATTFEVGVRRDGDVQVALWAFRTLLDDAVIKSPEPALPCPPASPLCDESLPRFRLVNAAERSVLHGLEASAHHRLPWSLSARATLAWTWGQGPDVADPGGEPVPLSRVPPLNGTAELWWQHPVGLSAAVALRWATLQDRLALADVSDARIPAGGTPGFAVFDLRLSYRLGSGVLATLVLENLFDAVYRYHGSSVNGPGRGVVFLLDVGPLWRVL